MATVICPKCGKQLVVSDPDRKFMFCEYCGTKIDFPVCTNANANVNVNINLNYSKSEHTEHIVDEAKIKSAENVNRVIGIFAAPIEAIRKSDEEEERQEAEEEKRAEEAKRERKDKIMRGEYSTKEMLVDFFQSLNIPVILAVILFIGLLVFVNRMDATTKHQARLDALEQEKQTAAHLSMNQGQILEFDSSADARTFIRDLKSHGFVNVTSETVSSDDGKEYEIVEVLVDGAPDYDPDTWYPLDTDIVVRYYGTNQ